MSFIRPHPKRPAPPDTISRPHPITAIGARLDQLGVVLHPHEWSAVARKHNHRARPEDRVDRAPLKAEASRRSVRRNAPRRSRRSVADGVIASHLDPPQLGRDSRHATPASPPRPSPAAHTRCRTSAADPAFAKREKTRRTSHSDCFSRGERGVSVGIFRWRLKRVPGHPPRGLWALQTAWASSWSGATRLLPGLRWWISTASAPHQRSAGAQVAPLVGLAILGCCRAPIVAGGERSGWCRGWRVVRIPRRASSSP